jgi:hypothetical protein
MIPGDGGGEGLVLNTRKVPGLYVPSIRPGKWHATSASKDAPRAFRTGRRTLGANARKARRSISTTPSRMLQVQAERDLKPGFSSDRIRTGKENSRTLFLSRRPRTKSKPSRRRRRIWNPSGQWIGSFAGMSGLERQKLPFGRSSRPSWAASRRRSWLQQPCWRSSTIRPSANA